MHPIRGVRTQHSQWWAGVGVASTTFYGVNIPSPVGWVDNSLTSTSRNYANRPKCSVEMLNEFITTRWPKKLSHYD